MRAATVLALALLGWSETQAAPIMSEPITLDHGLRYPTTRHSPGSVQALKTSEGLLLTYNDSGTITWFRRGPALEEVDWRPHALLSGRSDPYATSYRLAHLEPKQLTLITTEWFEETSPRQSEVSLRVFLESSLAQLVERRVVRRSARETKHPELCGNDSVVLAAWLEDDDTAHLARLDPALDRLPGDDLVLPNADWRTRLALTLQDDGGWLLYLTRDARAMALPLGADGIPTGAARELMPGALVSAVSIGRLGDQWLAALSRGPEVLGAWLNRTDVGAVFTLLPRSSCVFGLSIACNDSIAAVVCHGCEAPMVRACLVRLGRNEPVATLELAGGVEQEHSDEAPLTDAVWDGSGFLALWLESVGGPVNRAGGDWQHLPVSVRRFSEKGVLRDPEPVAINVASRVEQAALFYQQGNLTATTRDAFGSSYRQHVELRADGMPLGVGREFPLKVWSNFESSQFLQLFAQRQWNDRQALLQAEFGEWMTDYGSSTSSALRITRLAEGGATDLEVLVPIDSRPYDNCDVPRQFDIVGRGDTLFVAFDQVDPHAGARASSVRLRRLHTDGSVVSEWGTNAEEIAGFPTMRSVAGGVLCIWALEVDGVWQLRTSTIAADGNLRSLVGRALLPEPGNQIAPWLIDGASGWLCVYLWSDPALPAHDQVRALRISEDGTPIDSTPVVLAGGPGVRLGLTGVWSGSEYVVFWNELSAEGWSLRANRVATAGPALDGNGFLVSTGSQRGVLPASDGMGRVAVVYGDQLRFIEDRAVPVLPSAPSATARDRGIAIDWDLPAEFAGAVPTIYRRELASLEERCAPPLGFDRREIGIQVINGQEVHAFDDAVEPGGVYAYCLRLDAGSEALWTEASIAHAGAAFQLSLEVAPNPIRAGATLVLDLPSDVPRVSLEFWDPGGRLVDRVLLGPLTAGAHRIEWPGANRRSGLASGVYFCRVTAGRARAEARLVLTR